MRRSLHAPQAALQSRLNGKQHLTWELPMLRYRQALEAIFQRTDYERQEQPPYTERVWRLGRMEELLEQLGNPQRAMRAMHVAGTKGKGSTTAMIESVLRAAGYHTGMYTSPHLHTFRERIRVDGQLIPEEDVARLVERLAPPLATRPEVTVFEIITALAMCYFADRQTELEVFEVGMGGRLDATNVLRPLVSVITSISLDHVKVLGDTVEAIAREKAGIVKPGVPVVTAPQQTGAMQVIREAADRCNAPLVVVGQDWCWRSLRADLGAQRFAVFRQGHEADPEYPELSIPLLGVYQLENACTVVAAIEVLRGIGLPIGAQAVREGLATVRWPGRLEVLGQRPLVVVDGAHNPYSVERMLRALRDHLRYEQLIVVFGASMTHNPENLLALLLPPAHSLLVTQAHHPKATPAADLKAMAAALGRTASTEDTVRAALRRALADAGPADLVLVTGSLFVVAEAEEAWAELQGLPAFPADPPGVYDVPTTR